MNDNKLSYTNKDIKVIREELVEYAKTLTNNWTDFNESDLGMVFIELMAGIADMLNFYLDKQALETYLSTVKQRKNGKGILSLLGYKFRMINSCKATIDCEVLIPDHEEFLIPKYSKVEKYSYSNIENLPSYVTAYDFIVEKGIDKFSIPIIQGIPRSIQIPAKDIPSDMKIYLNNPNIAENSICIELDGYDWVEVEDVMMDDEDDRKFSVHETKNDITYILLHSSYKKFLPVDTNIPLNITYLESLGTEGAITANSIGKFDDSVVTTNGYKLSEILSISNPERSSGGSDRETLSIAKKRAVNNLYTMKAAVVLRDYADLAETVPGILKATAIDWSVEDSKYVLVPYLVKVYVVPENGDLCSSGQLLEVKEFLDKKKVSTVTVECLNADYIVVDIDVEVFTRAPESKYNSIRSSIISSLESFFHIDGGYNSESKVDFGSGVMYSNINSIIERSSNLISYVNLISPSSNIHVEAYQIPKLGNINIDIKKA